MITRESFIEAVATSRRRWLVGALATTLTGVLGYTVLWPEPTEDPFRAASITDSRACPGSNDELADVTNHFGLALPEDATDVQFYSNVNGLFGERALGLQFRTTRAGLEQFIGQAGFPAPNSTDPGTSRMQPWPDSCGLSWPQVTARRWRDAEPVNGRLREVDVDDSDSEHPLVFCSAMDV